MKPVSFLLRQDSSAGTSALGAAGPKPTVSLMPVWVAFQRAEFGWLRTVKAGKFCHARRLESAGQEEMYGASKVHAHDCGIPVSNHTGIGKSPAN